MTIKSRTDLKALFETDDVPTATDYTDWLESFVSLSDTSAQAILSPISATKVTTPLVSAQNINASAVAIGTVNAGVVNATATASLVSINVDGDVTLTSGKSLQIFDGGTIGVATLTSGQVIVSSTDITSNTFFTHASGGGSAQGFVWVSALTSGSNFVLKSSDANDGSKVNWMAIEKL